MPDEAVTGGVPAHGAPGPAGPPGRPWSGDGREELAAAVRRLMELTVTSAPAPGLLVDAAARVDAVCERLAAAVPDDRGPDGSEPVPRFAGSYGEPGEPGGRAGFTDAMPFDMVVGACNPLAPPIELWFDPPVARGRAVFTPTYEGAPGWVHGAALAAAFDIILTAANVLADAAGPTVVLTVRYRRPTLIGVESLFESEVTEVGERRTHSRGVLTQNGKVTVEAAGEFVNIDQDKVATLHRLRSRHDGPRHDEPVGG
jgi:acyl-coenzyme A thioesterase PaaI-like protein